MTNQPATKPVTKPATVPDSRLRYATNIPPVDHFNLPEKFKWIEPWQWDAVSEVVDCFDDGMQVMFVDAPTGAGKTLIGELVRQVLAPARTLYICNGKDLQEQFAHDFPYAKVLKGRSNYPTQTRPFPAYTAADCTKRTGADGRKVCDYCPHVPDCKYERAKAAALKSELAVVNTNYFLTEANYVGGFSGWDFVIVDEADTLEEILMGFVEFNVSERVLKELGLDAPRKGSHKTTIIEWIKNELQPALATQIRVLRNQDDTDKKRRASSYERLGGQSRLVVEGFVGERWVRDNDAGPLVLKPVDVQQQAQDYFWCHADRWLLMSATIISTDEMAVSLGLTSMTHRVTSPASETPGGTGGK